jgi:hypothetical protein
MKTMNQKKYVQIIFAARWILYILADIAAAVFNLSKHANFFSLVLGSLIYFLSLEIGLAGIHFSS